MKRPVMFAACLAIAACHRYPAKVALRNVNVPEFMLGEFEDDYGGRHTVSRDEWVQGRTTRYHIVRWVPDKQYLIAQNDSLNRYDGRLFTRIDWLPLEGMAPYTWAFCFSAYKATTIAVAETVSIAHRDAPRIGCNKFPFSRIKRLAGNGSK